MEFCFAKRMEQLKPGIFQQLAQRKKQLEQQGKAVCDLSVGTPDFAPPANVMEAVSRAA